MANLPSKIPKYALPGPYLTRLSPRDEQSFNAWVSANKVPFDPSTTADYDMKGFYKGLMSGHPAAKQEVSKFDKAMHFSDYWKTPYHRTFSSESQWAKPGAGAPTWEGDRLIAKDGTVIADETPEGSNQAIPTTQAKQPASIDLSDVLPLANPVQKALLRTQ